MLRICRWVGSILMKSCPHRTWFQAKKMTRLSQGSWWKVHTTTLCRPMWGTLLMWVSRRRNTRNSTTDWKGSMKGFIPIKESFMTKFPPTKGLTCKNKLKKSKKNKRYSAKFSNKKFKRWSLKNANSSVFKVQSMWSLGLKTDWAINLKRKWRRLARQQAAKRKPSLILGLTKMLQRFQRNSLSFPEGGLPSGIWAHINLSWEAWGKISLKKCCLLKMVLQGEYKSCRAPVL